MPRIGHSRAASGRSAFRVFAPLRESIAIVLEPGGERLPLVEDEFGYWTAELPALPHGTLYRIEVDGRRVPDPASRCQPQGVHGPSMVVDIEPARSPGWRGVPIDDAVIYELHVGTFTPEGTLAAAAGRLEHLRELGVSVVELLPIAAFPGERNWGYDGVYPYALHRAYGLHADLKATLERAHALGIAVILDVVYNHFGPEGHYAGLLAPYTKQAHTPWGAAINLDGEFNYGVREFFLENARYWLEDVGFDGLRVDAASMMFDTMPVHLLRELTDLARGIGQRQDREVLMIAEHLRNNRHVTSPAGFGFHSQWNDDLNHAIFACLTGETQRHYMNFGSFEDVVDALRRGFVLDGTRLDRYHRYFLGTDAATTRGTEHVVHLQNHDQVGNRPLGDRMITSYGRDKALLGITAVFASPFVPMLFMGEEYGETAPFLFVADFSEPALVEGVREGRKADFGFGEVEPPDPHDPASFEASKLQWARAPAPQGRRIRGYYRSLIALKRSGALGPRDRGAVRVSADTHDRIVTIDAPRTRTVLNFGDRALDWQPPAGATVLLRSFDEGLRGLPPFGAVVLQLPSPDGKETRP